MVPRIDLTEEEEELQETLKKELNCSDLEIRHDYYAVTNNKKNGNLVIYVYGSVCDLDSTSFEKVIFKTVDQITPILSHKANYKSLTFYTSITKPWGSKTSVETCYKECKVFIAKPNQIIYPDSFKDYYKGE
ncbi:hypothetical protein GCM10023183_33330 [Nibribacter koreensis]|uniref:Immunity protein 7 n=2 Tax=Nibribacter koreensis TaxID=1084519 RepID=A0ABP8FYC4_9BACT